MKFGETLKQNLIPEWASQYVDYDNLKLIIDQIILQKNNPHGSQLLAEQFAHRFYMYLAQVQDFFLAILQKQTELVVQLENYLLQSVPRNQLKKFTSIMTKNCQEVFKSLEMLKNFGATNATGFKKIYKKYKKNAVVDLGIDVDQELLESGFNDPQRVEIIEHRIEQVFCTVHNIDDTTKARKLLFEYQIDQQAQIRNKGRHLLAIGMLIGFFGFTFLAFLQLTFQHNMYRKLPTLSNLMFRIMFVGSILILSLGMMLQVFEQKRINYIFILELPPSQVASGFRFVYLLAFIAVVVFSLTGLLLLTSYDNQLVVPLPLGALINMVGRLMRPLAWSSAPLYLASILLIVKFLQIMRGRGYVSRFLAIIFFKLITPWRHRVTFPLFFTADILTSMTGMLTDYLNLLLIGRAPEWLLFIGASVPTCIRACQCILKYKEKYQAYPHLANLVKYLISVPSNLSYFDDLYESRAGFLTINIWKFIEACYKTYWDIFQDFGCFSGGFGGLTFRNNPEKWKNRIICRRPSAFSTFNICTIVAADVVLRFSFLVVAIKDEFKASIPIMGVFQGLEILRRFIWAFLRLDNQQATNCEGYLTTNFVPILLSEKERRNAKVMEETQESLPFNQDIARFSRADTMAVNAETLEIIRQSRCERQEASE